MTRLSLDHGNVVTSVVPVALGKNSSVVVDDEISHFGTVSDAAIRTAAVGIGSDLAVWADDDRPIVDRAGKDARTVREVDATD